MKMALTVRSYGVAGLILLVLCCAGSRRQLPDHAVQVRGQAASEFFNRGEFTQALRMYRKALGEAERFDIPALQARYVFNIGRIHYECAAFDSAERRFTESREIFMAAGDTAGTAISGIFESLSRAYAGDTDSASVMLRRFSGMISPGDEAVAATARTIVCLLRGEADSASRAADRAVSLLRGRGDTHGLGVIYYYRAMLAFMGNDARGAVCSLDSSLLLLGRSGSRYRNWKTLLGRSIVEFCSGNGAGGEKYYMRAKKAAPGLVRFPPIEAVGNCPKAWERSASAGE